MSGMNFLLLITAQLMFIKQTFAQGQGGCPQTFGPLSNYNNSDWSFGQVVKDCLCLAPMDGKCAGHWMGDDIADWDVSQVKGLAYAFDYQQQFNGNLSKWDVSQVTNFNGCFMTASKFEGKGLENWDMKNAKNTQDMFWNATSFNGKISNWKTNQVTNMQWMFDTATSFTQDLSSWTKHDGETSCTYDENTWEYVCKGGQGADTTNMFLSAFQFLNKYTCGISGPPKDCMVSGNAPINFDSSSSSTVWDSNTGSYETAPTWVVPNSVQNYYDSLGKYTLEDMTIWGAPRFNVQTGKTITNMKFDLTDEYALMIGGVVLPGVLIACLILLFTIVYFVFRCCTCCIWVLTGSLECCFKTKAPSARKKTIAKVLVVLTSLISVAGCALIYIGATELPVAVQDLQSELSLALESLQNQTIVIDTAYTNAASLIASGGQSEKTEIQNTLASVRKVVDLFGNEIEKYMDDIKTAALILASLLLVVSIAAVVMVLGNFKKCIVFTGIPLWIFLLISWIMFGVFLGLSQFFDDLNETALQFQTASAIYPPAGNPFTGLDYVLPCFTDKVSLDMMTSSRAAIAAGVYSINKNIGPLSKNANISPLSICPLSFNRGTKVSCGYDLIDQQYEQKTALEMCGPVNGFFDTSESVYSESYKALACNLHERLIISDSYIVYETTNWGGYVNATDSKSYTVPLETAVSYYAGLSPPYNLSLAQALPAISMINAMPKIASVARCDYAKSFVLRISAEGYFNDPLTASGMYTSEDTILFRLLHFSEMISIAWFLIGFSYLILYITTVKYMFWMQAADKEVLSEQEMAQVWGSYHEK